MGSMAMHVYRCGPGGRWWQPTAGFMTMHAVTCMLTAKYVISSVPQHDDDDALDWLETTATTSLT